MARRYLYLVRHGEYESTSSPDEEPEGSLTANGLEQANLTGQRLSGLPITMIYYSTSQRALETAEIIARQLPGVPSQPSGLLRECIPIIPENFRDYFADLPPERFSEDGPRAQKAFDIFFQPISSGNNDQHDVIISHGNLTAFFISRVLNAPTEAFIQIEIKQCSISQVIISARRFMKIGYVNDTSHLNKG